MSKTADLSVFAYSAGVLCKKIKQNGKNSSKHLEKCERIVYHMYKCKKTKAETDCFARYAVH